MSREIKFRVWNNNTNKYEYTELDYYFVIDQRIKAYEYEQYTGLKDKNGKEIYEGDRIKIEGSDSVYTVEYGRGVWVARFGDESGDNICLFHYVQKNMVLYAEVIGNIHEPPKDFRPEHLKRMGISISKGGEE